MIYTNKEIFDLGVKYFDLSADELIAPCRLKGVLWPRQVLQYVMWKHAKNGTLQEISFLFSQDRTTIHNGLKKVDTCPIRLKILHQFIAKMMPDSVVTRHQKQAWSIDADEYLINHYYNASLKILQRNLLFKYGIDETESNISYRVINVLGLTPKKQKNITFKPPPTKITKKNRDVVKHIIQSCKHDKKPLRSAVQKALLYININKPTFKTLKFMAGIYKAAKPPQGFVLGQFRGVKMYSSLQHGGVVE